MTGYVLNAKENLVPGVRLKNENNVLSVHGGADAKHVLNTF